MKRIGLITLALLACQTKQPRTETQGLPKTEVVQEAPEKVVPVTGWRNLRWGDTSKQVTAKSKGGRLVCGWASRDGKKKGHMTGSQVCFLTNESGGRLAMVNLIYLDDTLQRIAVSYLGLSPDSSEVDNLNDLLVQRYCLLSLGDSGALVHLNAAIKQARQGNAGQSLQLHSTCKISPGDFFVQVQNNVGSSDVRIFLSSDLYGSYLQQNEFAEQWEDAPAIERPAEPNAMAIVAVSTCDVHRHHRLRSRMPTKHPPLTLRANVTRMEAGARSMNMAIRGCAGTAKAASWSRVPGSNLFPSRRHHRLFIDGKYRRAIPTNGESRSIGNLPLPRCTQVMATTGESRSIGRRPRVQRTRRRASPINRSLSIRLSS